MNFDFEIEAPLLKTMVGGKSVLDSPRLHIKTKDEAYSFIKSYGFDLHQESEVQKLWGYHRRALVFLQEKLLDPGETIPEKIADPKQLVDLRELLLFASSDEAQNNELRRWSCALLRVMHIFVHSEKDLFSYYSAEIQKQILGPIQECVIHQSDQIILKHPFSTDEIKLVNFEIKPFKTASSSAIKLLAKPDVVALKVLDKIGVRFVTETLFDAFQVALFLAKNNLINYAHVMPDQSSNTLFPLDLLLNIIQENNAVWTKKEDFYKNIEDRLQQRLSEEESKNSISFGQESDLKYIRKENNFSSSDYRFLKFICRKLITLQPESGREPFRFFYPFEIQIVDRHSHQQNESGAANHSEYKLRQRQAARLRVFPDLNGSIEHLGDKR